MKEIETLEKANEGYSEGAGRKRWKGGNDVIVF